MKIRVFQINLERDKEDGQIAAFESLERLRKHGLEVDPTIYDLVYSGETTARDLEDVFTELNVGTKPANYYGRSMSVSDITEVIEADAAEPGFYFCDSFGFQKIQFDAEKATGRIGPINEAEKI